MGKSDFTTLRFNSFTDKGSIDFSLCNELNNSNIQLIGKALKKSTAKVPEVRSISNKKQYKKTIEKSGGL